ncbi:MAG: rhodanese-like domain-containing protein [Zhengella sp.]|uniref:rhodanese-like domain-containing protein n=1 Tax=Zhengella sp. TaxID=2282762 RepID=UPI001DCE9382|nr:rhodanese-like domain-containing protein [Notoacmeibacter sp.]MCC0028064.1 rhodanese-like domain-containing protein [Brucellaceae bacterium]
MRILAALLAVLLSAVSSLAADRITPRQAHEAIGNGELVLVDIRTPDEWRETGIPAPATPIDMTARDFVPKLRQVLAENPDKTVGFICRTGNRSSYLTGVLAKAGLTNIVDVTGGVAGNGRVTGWIAEGLPMKPHCETC